MRIVGVLVAAGLGAAIPAHADPAAAVPPARLAKFIRETCDWMSRDYERPETKIAEHIGRITGTDAERIFVDIPALPHWAVSVVPPGLVDMKVPEGARITVAQLERFFGPAHEADVDQRLSASATERSDGTREMLDFARTGRKKMCALSTVVLTRTKNRSESTVESITLCD